MDQQYDYNGRLTESRIYSTKFCHFQFTDLEWPINY